MPRKVKHMPHGLLHIEGLSRDLVSTEQQPSDFDPNEIIEVRTVIPRAKRPYAPQAKRERERSETEAKQLKQAKQLLRSRTIADAIVRGVQAPAKPIEPKHNQVHTESGLVITVQGKRNPIRRL